MSLTRNFTIEELECRCGCGFLPAVRAIEALQLARDTLGRPIRVTSGARCAKHNAAIGGAPNSYHVQGLAFDIAVPDDRYRLALLRAMMSAGFTTFILYPDRIHADLRPSRDAFLAIHTSSADNKNKEASK